MVNALTLTSATYDVLKRVPLEWWDYEDVVRQIAAATSRQKLGIRCSTSRSFRRPMICCRIRQTLPAVVEIRLVAKD